MQQSQAITRQSASNLELAFVLLPKPKRDGMSALYAFCREVDDVADEDSVPVEKRRKGLAAWSADVRRACEGGTPEFEVNRELQPVIRDHCLRFELFDELIKGCEMDLDTKRYETHEQLELYCHRVASVVGLLSIEIFGYRNPRCQEYAVELGLALQTTNIIRDVGKDMRLGRVYLPQDERARFGYSENELVNGIRNDAFLALMKFQAERSRGFYREAASLLPPEDRRAMVAAEIMASVYATLLERISAAGFRVFEKEYRLGRLAKSFLVLRRLVSR